MDGWKVGAKKNAIPVSRNVRSTTDGAAAGEVPVVEGPVLRLPVDVQNHEVDQVVEIDEIAEATLRSISLETMLKPRR